MLDGDVESIHREGEVREEMKTTSDAKAPLIRIDDFKDENFVRDSQGRLHGEVNVNSIIVDDSYQRELKYDVIKRLLKEFDINAVDPIVLNRREDGTFAVIDGQHRLYACKMKAIKTIQCMVLEGLTREKEAELFCKYNVNRGPLRATQVFWAKIAAKDRYALEIKKIIDENGLELGDEKTKDSGKNKLVCVAAIQKIHKTDGPEMLDRVLRLVKQIWDGEKESMRGSVIEGMWRLLKKYDDLLDETRFVNRLRGKPIEAIKEDAEKIIKIHGSHASFAFAIAVWKAYNYRLPDAKKLPNRFVTGE